MGTFRMHVNIGAVLNFSAAIKGGRGVLREPLRVQG